MAERKKWFKARRYGWGWTPVAWQGWLVLGAYIFLCIATAYYLLPQRNDEFGFVCITAFTLLFISLTSFLIGICYRTGENPKWNWGKKENNNEENDRR